VCRIKDDADMDFPRTNAPEDDSSSEGSDDVDLLQGVLDSDPRTNPPEPPPAFEDGLTTEEWLAQFQRQFQRPRWLDDLEGYAEPFLESGGSSSDEEPADDSPFELASDDSDDGYPPFFDRNDWNNQNNNSWNDNDLDIGIDAEPQPNDPRNYSERFYCCACLELHALDELVVADCGHAVLCRECWQQNQRTPRRDTCSWCRHVVRRYCSPRVWPTAQTLFVLDEETNTMTTKANTQLNLYVVAARPEASSGHMQLREQEHVVIERRGRPQLFHACLRRIPLDRSDHLT
jgi:hypothetical protein